MNKNKKELEKQFKSEFIKQSDTIARTGKQVYIRPEYHERISLIAHVIGKRGITMADYIDNVLTEHFSQNEEEIKKLLNDSTRQAL